MGQFFLLKLVLFLLKYPAYKKFYIQKKIILTSSLIIFKNKFSLNSKYQLQNYYYFILPTAKLTLAVSKQMYSHHQTLHHLDQRITSSSCNSTMIISPFCHFNISSIAPFTAPRIFDQPVFVMTSFFVFLADFIVIGNTITNS